MKKITTFAVTAALAMAGAVTAPQAVQAQAKDNVDTCRTLVAAQVFPSLGECVSLFRSGYAKACENYDTGFLAFFGFKNRGECVKFFRSLD